MPRRQGPRAGACRQADQLAVAQRRAGEQAEEDAGDGEEEKADRKRDDLVLLHAAVAARGRASGRAALARPESCAGQGRVPGCGFAHVSPNESRRSVSLVWALLA